MDEMRPAAPRRARWPRRTGRLALAALAAGAGAGAVVLLPGTPASPRLPLASGAAAAPSASAVALQSSFVRALQAAAPSVVEISTTSGLGSGVVYDGKGDVVTNAHVVGKSRSFTVELSNGRRVPATLVGTYTPDDLAVIHLASATGTRAASFANSGALKVGDLALAIGSPLGLSGSVTDGIVSSVGRSVPEGNGVVLADLVQTSAAINPGNSGGALVNLSGRVIGIPTLAASSESGDEYDGIGFAIPSNTVRLIAPQLIKSGKVTTTGRASLGIAGETATSQGGVGRGVYVTSVVPGGPAAKAGITAGSTVLAVNGRPVASVTDLEALLAELKPGQRVPVKVLLPNGTQRTVSVVLGDRAAG